MRDPVTTVPMSSGFIPRDAIVVAYADVADVMASEVRRKLHKAIPFQENGQREFQEQTGINIETDIDHLVACLNPDASAGNPGAGMIVARGRFDEVKIEALMRQHGAHVEDSWQADGGGRSANTRPVLLSRSWSPGWSPSAARTWFGRRSTCIRAATIRKRAWRASRGTKS
jgi:hypothetical protein